MRTFILVIALFTFGSWTLADKDLEKVDKLWEKANALYQLGLYEEAVRDFEICLDAYDQANDKVMVAMTKASLAFCYIRMGDDARANYYADNIRFHMKDSDWHETMAQLHEELGHDELQAKYIKKAEKFK